MFQCFKCQSIQNYMFCKECFNIGKIEIEKLLHKK